MGDSDTIWEWIILWCLDKCNEARRVFCHILEGILSGDIAYCQPIEPTLYASDSLLHSYICPIVLSLYHHYDTEVIEDIPGKCVGREK
jgi:hypothetical protein